MQYSGEQTYGYTEGFVDDSRIFKWRFKAFVDDRNSVGRTAQRQELTKISVKSGISRGLTVSVDGEKRSENNWIWLRTTSSFFPVIILSPTGY